MKPKVFIILIFIAFVIDSINCRPGNEKDGGGGGGDHHKGGGAGGGKGSSSGGLEVVISFDSLDCNSQSFFNNYLKPIYAEMSKCVKWHFIPCSTSHIVEDVLQCTNGVEECKIDALHACAAHYYENDEQSLGKFFLCMMGSNNQMCSAEKCATSAGLDWKKLKGCKPCNEAGKWCDNRFKQLNMLHEPKIPGVLFDMKYNAQAEQAAMTDLKGAICDQIKKKNLQCAACAGSGGGGGGCDGDKPGSGKPSAGGKPSKGGSSDSGGSPGTGGSLGGGGGEHHKGGGSGGGSGDIGLGSGQKDGGVSGGPAKPHVYGDNAPPAGTLIDAQGNITGVV